MTKTVQRIITIIPASDWKASFDGSKADGTEQTHNDGLYESLACFALVEYTDRSQAVVGMAGYSTLDVCEKKKNFKGYLKAGGLTRYGI